MAQNLGFNVNFTDEDAVRLCQLAPIANHPEHYYHRCGWMTGHAACGLLVHGSEFSEHLRTHHGVGGPDKAQLMCCWLDCSTEMKKESLVRHVNEKHLEFRHACPNCAEQFTRSYTLHKHVLRKHSGS